MEFADLDDDYLQDAFKKSVIGSIDSEGGCSSYTEAVRPAFDDLRKAAMQLAGLLVLSVTGVREAVDHQMFESTIESYAEATEVLRRVKPPLPGVHQYTHLLQAHAAVGAAIQLARVTLHKGDEAQGHLRQSLQQGLDHLRWAARAVPGFEIVAFSQGCCAAHTMASSTDTVLRCKSTEDTYE